MTLSLKHFVVWDCVFQRLSREKWRFGGLDWDKEQWILVVGMRPWWHWMDEELLEGNGAADNGKGGAGKRKLSRRQGKLKLG